MSTMGNDIESRRPQLPEGRYVWLPGRGRTFVREVAGPAGAPVLVLLHGWMATADLNWSAAFTALGRHFRVLALDHRGHGRGLRPAERFNLEDCADDVDALARQLGIDHLVAVGYSMGGPIAQLLWRRHPELVSGLVLCATSPTFRGTPREQVLFGLLDGTARAAAVAPLRAVTRTAALGWSRLRLFRRGSAWAREDVLRHDWAQILEAGRAIGRFDARPWSADISVPTAVIATEDDEVVPFERQRRLADLIPGATLRTIAGGHAACTSTPEVFVPQLIAACLEVTSAPTTTPVPLLVAA
jgi:3-oxoadipate enol-lactonase